MTDLAREIEKAVRRDEHLRTALPPDVLLAHEKALKAKLAGFFRRIKPTIVARLAQKAKKTHG